MSRPRRGAEAHATSARSRRQRPAPSAPLPPGLDLAVPGHLPIAEQADRIAEALTRHQVVVVAGETGSGKTTQIPKICLRLGRRAIAHTQPRRIAARSVAERLADEVGTPIGEVVGYQVRFTRKVGRATRVSVMTDGVLLAAISHDRDLRRYDTIIIDEAHERSLNIDFLLGYLKQILPRRPDLRVIVTSATIDTARFSAHFGDAPIIEVMGRTYPVETRYRPVEREDGEVDQVTAICEALVEVLAEPVHPGAGDVLVFASGEREIRDAAEAIEALDLGLDVVPLYARLSAAEQHRVFAPHAGRRVVLATNVAETSLTVPGIGFVIDPGTARISRWSARTKVQRLPIEPISQASANQRAGRCGRLAPGVCLRLYSEQDFQLRPEFTEPEILRTNLASVIVQMADAGLGDIAGFPFVEAPDPTQIGDGLRLLTELGALADQQPTARSSSQAPPAKRVRLTPVGRQLARIPVDPRLARMLVEAANRNCLREAQIVVAALAIPDVRERPTERREQADAAHRRFSHPTGDPQEPTPAPGQTAGAGPRRITAHTGWGDFAGGKGRQRRTGGGAGAPPEPGGDIEAILRLWDYLDEQRRARTSSAFRRMCRDEFLNYLRIREWQDLRGQLRDICRDLDLKRNRDRGAIDDVLISVLSGLLSHVGLAEEPRPPSKAAGGRDRRSRGPREYLGARGARFAINPGSALAKHPPDLVMAVELVETTRLWARTCAEIQAEWIEQVGAHALRSRISEPHWSASRGSAAATETVTLYGVPIFAGRSVGVGRIAPEVARQMFIQHALVEGDWTARHDFMDHNSQVRARADDMAERSRRHDLMSDDALLYDFYDQRLPSEVVSGASFEAWWAQIGDRHLLDLTEADVVRSDSDTVDAQDFPDQWPDLDVALPVRYVFDPGSGHDGVTVEVPLPVLNQVDQDTLSWQVPGLREELAVALIRTLPKKVRTHFVPAPDRARQAIEWLGLHGDDRRGSFSAALGRALTAITGVEVAPTDWRPDEVPAHLRVTVEVTDADRVVATGTDADVLRSELGTQVAKSLTSAHAEPLVTGATTWVFGTIPEQIRIRPDGAGSTEAVGYPALRDEGSSVGEVVTDSVRAQRRSHARGVRRLLVCVNPDPTKWVVSHLGREEKLALAASPYPSVPDLLADARLKAGDSLARQHSASSGSGDLSEIRDEAGFESMAVWVRERQAATMQSVVNTAAAIFIEQASVQVALDQVGTDVPAAQDVRAQLADLIFDRFIAATPDPWYGYLPRYLKGMRIRLEQVMANPTRDATQAQVIDEVEADYADLCAEAPPGPLDPEVEEIGFLIEELRVSLFAQKLGTRVPVSPKRIRTAIARVREGR